MARTAERVNHLEMQMEALSGQMSTSMGKLGDVGITPASRLGSVADEEKPDTTDR